MNWFFFADKAETVYDNTSRIFPARKPGFREILGLRGN